MIIQKTAVAIRDHGGFEQGLLPMPGDYFETLRDYLTWVGARDEHIASSQLSESDRPILCEFTTQVSLALVRSCKAALGSAIANDPIGPSVAALLTSILRAADRDTHVKCEDLWGTLSATRVAKLLGFEASCFSGLIALSTTIIENNILPVQASVGPLGNICINGEQMSMVAALMVGPVGEVLVALAGVCQGPRVQEF